VGLLGKLNSFLPIFLLGFNFLLFLTGLRKIIELRLDVFFDALLYLMKLFPKILLYLSDIIPFGG
jgi:hypothetical protein